MQYYGTRLSENISRREPEGYLLCLNVPVARTGTQDYLPQELGLPPTRGPDLISVFRPEEEVFSPATIASFEGMPVTNDHPPEGVDTSNIRALQKGHAHNVRRGTGEEADLLLADLIITDPYLIRLIMEEGKREISCGYTYELCEENGEYIQRKIRGNHVAVVDAGRAGPRVSIKDHSTTESERRTKPMKKSKNKSLCKILARMAKDGDTETVAEIIEEMMEPEIPAESDEAAEAEAEAAEPAEAEGEPAAETPEVTVVVDEDVLAEVLSRLDQIITLLSGPVTDDDPIEEMAQAIEEGLEAAGADPIVDENENPAEAVAQISEVVEQILDPTAQLLSPAGEDEDDPNERPVCAGDVLRAGLNMNRSDLMRLNSRGRKRVCGDMVRHYRGPKTRKGKAADTGSPYAAIRRKAVARGPVGGGTELGRRIMATRNVNYKKQ